MAQPENELLDLLKFELKFVEDGGGHPSEFGASSRARFSSVTACVFFPVVAYTPPSAR